MEEKFTVVRILQYTGTRKMIENCMMHDSVKGVHVLPNNDLIIRSAYLLPLESDSSESVKVVATRMGDIEE